MSWLDLTGQADERDIGNRDSGGGADGIEGEDSGERKVGGQRDPKCPSTLHRPH